MASKFTNFCLGFTIGASLSYTAHDIIIEKMLALIGKSYGLKSDHLSFKHLDISLREKRKLFKTALEEKGPSYRLQYMISDSNFKAFEESTSENLGDLKVLEETFRSYYPELFDDKPGHEFILSLNLKTKCDDHNIPKMIKIRR